MTLILVDAAGVVVGAAASAAGRIAPGGPVPGELGQSLLDRLDASAGDADLAALAAALRALLAGQRHPHELRAADGRWSARLWRLTARRPPAAALLIQAPAGVQVTPAEAAVRPGLADPAPDAPDLPLERDRLEDLLVSRTVQLAEARERADAATRAKSAFLAQASHEIRSPLNVIIGLAHLLQRAEADPARLTRVRAIEQAGRHLSAIIDEVLDLARADGKQPPLQLRPLRPAVLLDEVAALLRPEAEDRGLRVEVDTAAGGPWLRGDATRLRQALLNAGRWALASAAGGALRLRARVGEPVDGRVSLSLEILSAAAMPGPAFDVDPALVAMRRLARLMSARCGIDSDGGAGSRSWFLVELDIDDDQAPAPTAAAALRQRHAGRHVLVAEDEEVMRQVMLELLAELQLEVELAADGRQAVDLAARVRPALILLDLQMPGLDGLAAARALRGLPGFQDTPIVALTANAFAEDRAACLAAGMNDFLAKPVEVEQLHQRLLHWLDRAPGVAPPPAAPARPGPALDDPLLAPLLALEGIDALGGLAAVGGRLAVYRRLLTVFDAAHRDDARHLQLALQRADPGSAARLAHRLRGAAATLGLVDIETAASALEQALEDGAAALALAPLLQAADEALAGTLQRLRQALAV